MIGFILGALKVIILLGSLITIHEFGHFIVAKLCKMKVLKFSIGFGPKLIHKQGLETEYSLRAIPLGGFVQLEGEDEESSDERAFSNKPVWQRILVLLAGVTMNILLALFIYLCIYMNINHYITSTISSDTDETILADAGLSTGDSIYKINGEKIYNDADVLRIIQSADSDNFIIEIVDPNGIHVKKNSKITKKQLGYVGIVFNDTTIYAVTEGQAGDKAGFKEGDKLIAIDNLTNAKIEDYLNIIKQSPEKLLNVRVQRGEEELTLQLLPASTYKREVDFKFVELKDLDFMHNLYYAWKETKYYLRANFIGIAELLSGKTENVEVQGIVGISQQISQTESFIEFFYMMSAISLSLGIMNLLPIPGLDGGKLLITIIEIFRRKPMNKETEAKITLIGFAFLLILMVYVTANDISKLF